MSEIEDLRVELAAYKREMARVALACHRGRMDEVASVQKVRQAKRELAGLGPSPDSQFWPGFTVQCDKCSGRRIALENSLGFSITSGAWGSVDFVCEDCGNRTEIVDT